MPTALTTPALIKRYLNLEPTPTRDDDILQSLADAVGVGLLSAVSSDMLSQSYREAYNGTGTNTLMLAHTPITAVSSVAIGYGTAVQVVPSTEYLFTTNALKRVVGSFPRGVANIQVNLTAGFAAYPADFVHAATKWAAMRYREFNRLGHRSVTLAQQTIAFDLSDLPPDVAAVVNRYSFKIPRGGVVTLP